MYEYVLWGVRVGDVVSVSCNYYYIDGWALKAFLVCDGKRKCSLYVTSHQKSFLSGKCNQKCFLTGRGYQKRSLSMVWQQKRLLSMVGN